jgi:hypothetical protein
MNGYSPTGDHKQMAELPQAEQAKKAIHHTLLRIRDHEYVGYYLGCGTQGFDLLTEAFASLTGDEVSQIRRIYAPRNATNPRDGID